MEVTLAHLLAVEHLRKAYRVGDLEIPVLVDASFGVERGEIAAIMGPSGCGKSTLLHLIGGLDDCDGGSVVVDGAIISALPPEDRAVFRRRNISYVFQSYNLISALTVEENVTAPLELDGRSVDCGRLDDALGRLGLMHLRDRFPHQLSGGEQQRAAIARALIHRPLLVLADEPTGSLDATSGRATMDFLVQTSRDHGVALLLVTHNSAVAGCADRVIEMRDGRVFESTPASGEPQPKERQST
jgi:putative ABC transport system ATP-binding protein